MTSPRAHRSAAALVVTTAVVACATVHPRTPAPEPVGTRDGARARAYRWDRASGLLPADDARTLDTLPLGPGTLLGEASLAASGADASAALDRLAAALPASACGPLEIIVEDRLSDGARFGLTEIVVALDDVEVLRAGDVAADDARRYLVFDGKVPPRAPPSSSTEQRPSTAATVRAWTSRHCGAHTGPSAPPACASSSTAASAAITASSGSA